MAERDLTIVPLSLIGASGDDLSRLVDEALALGAAGTIHPTIGQTCPLDRAADHTPPSKRGPHSERHCC